MSGPWPELAIMQLRNWVQPLKSRDSALNHYTILLHLNPYTDSLYMHVRSLKLRSRNVADHAVHTRWGQLSLSDVEGGCPLVEVLGLDSLGKQLLKKVVPIIQIGCTFYLEWKTSST